MSTVSSSAGTFRVSRAVRAGSVQAMRVWLELHDRQQDEPDDPFAALDAAANGHNGQSTIDRLARQTRERRTNRNQETNNHD